MTRVKDIAWQPRHEVIFWFLRARAAIVTLAKGKNAAVSIWKMSKGFDQCAVQSGNIVPKHNGC